MAILSFITYLYMTKTFMLYNYSYTDFDVISLIFYIIESYNTDYK